MDNGDILSSSIVASNVECIKTLKLDLCFVTTDQFVNTAYCGLILCLSMPFNACESFCQSFFVKSGVTITDPYVYVPPTTVIKEPKTPISNIIFNDGSIDLEMCTWVDPDIYLQNNTTYYVSWLALSTLPFLCNGVDVPAHIRNYINNNNGTITLSGILIDGTEILLSQCINITEITSTSKNVANGDTSTFLSILVTMDAIKDIQICELILRSNITCDNCLDSCEDYLNINTTLTLFDIYPTPP